MTDPFFLHINSLRIGRKNKEKLIEKQRLAYKLLKENKACNQEVNGEEVNGGISRRPLLTESNNI